MKSNFKTKTFNLLKATSLSLIIGSTLFVAVSPAQAGVGSQAARQIGKIIGRKVGNHWDNRQPKQSNYAQPSPTYNRR